MLRRFSLLGTSLSERKALESWARCLVDSVDGVVAHADKEVSMRVTSNVHVSLPPAFFPERVHRPPGAPSGRSGARTRGPFKGCHCDFLRDERSMLSAAFQASFLFFPSRTLFLSFAGSLPPRWRPARPGSLFCDGCLALCALPFWETRSDAYRRVSEMEPICYRASFDLDEAASADRWLPLVARPACIELRAVFLDCSCRPLCPVESCSLNV